MKRNAVIFAVTLPLLGMILSCTVFYPGSWSGDTFAYYEMAKSGKYGDWHDPAMAWLWNSMLLHGLPKSSLFILHTVMLWSGIALVTTHLTVIARFNAQKAILAAMFLGYSPNILYHHKFIVTDVALLSSWIFVVGIALTLPRLRATIFRVTAILLGCLALYYGSVVRHNSIAGLPPASE